MATIAYSWSAIRRALHVKHRARHGERQVIGA
jgi:hypothetical protein